MPSDRTTGPDGAALPSGERQASDEDPAEDLAAIEATRDLAEISAAELVGAHAVDLMTAAAVKIGLYEGTSPDLAEARILIEALAGLVEASAPSLGHHHALPLREGVKSLQVAFREAQEIPDPPGEGPGEGLIRRRTAG